MHRILSAFLILFLSIFSVQAAEVVSVEELIEAIEREDDQIWNRFGDFHKIHQKLNWLENKQYEEAQAADLLIKYGSYKIIEKLDQAAFLRVFPHLELAFQRQEVRKSFRNDYLMEYSYGWRRLFAWNNLRLSYKETQKQNKRLPSLFLDTTGQFLGNKENKLLGISWFGFKSLVKLAICDGYKPAAWDLVRVYRFKKEIKLSPVLSYLLLLRVDPKYVQLIEKKKWQGEIDQHLTIQDQQKFRSLLKQKDKLAETISYCKA